MAAKDDRIRKLFEKLRERQAEAQEIADEILRELGGEQTLGSTLRQLEGAYSEAWQRRYGSPYMFNFAKDRAHWKRLVKLGSVDDVIARVLSYLHDDDEYLRRQRHPFGLFVARFNQYAVDAPVTELALEAPVTDCRHTPPCRSDQEHTRKRMAEMRQ